MNKAIIVDIDKTIATIVDRHYYDWGKVESDLPIPFTIDLIKRYPNKVIILTGRATGHKKGTVYGREATERWIKTHLGDVECVLMRDAGDYRSSVVLKKELLELNVIGKYNVEFALDDDEEVCKMYNSFGIPTLVVKSEV